MRRQVWIVGALFCLVVSANVSLGQETDEPIEVLRQELLGQIKTTADTLRLVNAEMDSPSAKLHKKLLDQVRAAQRALQSLDAVKRQFARQAAQVSLDAPIRQGEEGFRALYSVDRHGTIEKFLLAAPGMISSSSPEWSHDATMLAFDAVPEIGSLGEAHLFVYAVGGPFKGSFKDFGCGNVPTWSPDDKRIAYMLNSGNPCEAEGGIWIMNADGTGRRWLRQGMYPRFSPDGKTLQVHAIEQSPSPIVLIDPDTGRDGVRLLGRKIDVKYGGGTWSPDGKRIVFVGTRDDQELVATVAVDDEKEESVVTLYTAGDDEELIGPPAWSPDGNEIVLAIHDKSIQTSSTRRWHNTYLYRLPADDPSTPTLLQLDKTGLVNRSPIWAPDGQTITFSSER
jgi:dipeptidyl aminopeptidase/acylaminoacyl peptidase